MHRLRAPAAYDRFAYPVHDRISFKLFANWFLVVGLVPFSAAIVLTTHLVPIARAHDRYGRRFRPGPDDVEP